VSALHDPPTISWFEPRWSFNASYAGELRQAGFTWRFLARIIAFGAVLAAATAILTRWLVPGLALSTVRLVLLPLIAPFYLLAMVGIHFLIPRRITVKSSRISIQHGQSVVGITPDRLLSAEIDDAERARPTLTLQYSTRRGRECVRAIGINSSVDLEALAHVLLHLLHQRPDQQHTPL
jgi:hypothetical protein